MVVQKDSGRKDTGRTDEYSNESPKKDYQDFRIDNPKDTAKEIAKDISSGKSKIQVIGRKSLEVKKQEFISHIQNFKETFSNAEKKEWLGKRDELMRNLESKN